MLNNWKLWIVVAFILAIFNLNIISHNSPLLPSSSFLRKENFRTFFDRPKQKQQLNHPTKQEQETPLIQHQRFIHSCPKEAEVMLEKRWSDREEEERQKYNKEKKKSIAFSLFNCFHPRAKCQYYYPANFFDEYCGIGKSFLPLVRELQERTINQTLWENMPYVGIPLVTFQQMCLSKEKKTGKKKRKKDADENNKRNYKGHRRRRLRLLEDDTNLKYARLTNIGRSYMNDTKTTTKCITERFSFIHVHKNGGTSVRDTFADLVERNSESGAIERNIIYMNDKKNNRIIFDRKSNKGGDTTSVDRRRGKASALELLQHATHYPTNGEYASQQVVLVTLVRDPLSRFISSIGQALGGQGSNRADIGDILRKVCVKNAKTSEEALLCLARYVKEHGFWIELHFTPQALEISFATMFQDVPVAVLEFPPAEIMEYIGGSAKQKLRDGAKEGYRSDPILTNMSVSHYTAASLKIVCDIYEMDVIMLRSLGIEVPKCDPYLS